MNYREELQLQINEAWQALKRCGWDCAARSVETSAASAGDDLVALMAAADHAAWHLQQLEAEGLRQANQYDRDCY